jgi:hypothetical protein
MKAKPWIFATCFALLAAPALSAAPPAPYEVTDELVAAAL